MSDKIYIGEKGFWIAQEQLEGMRHFSETMFANFLKGRKIIPRADANVKLAFVKKEGKTRMLGVDTETKKGYSLQDDAPVWRFPLIEEPYDEFERWCTPFDV